MNKTRRLTAVALVLLLLLSLCGCIAEELPEEISRPETTRTTPATTLSTAPTTTQAATATDTTAATSDNTTTQTATQTVTTVVTTQVTTKVTVTVTNPTAAPTTAAPQKPAIEWNVIMGELPEDGITPGVVAPVVRGTALRMDKVVGTKPDEHFGEIIESVAELDALVWNDPERAGEATNYKKPTYTDDFFEENVLIEFTVGVIDRVYYFSTEATTFDNGVLHLHLAYLEATDFSQGRLKIRVMLEITREDAAKIQEVIVYQDQRRMTAADRKHFWGVDW